VARSAVHASFGHDGADVKITIESTSVIELVRLPGIATLRCDAGFGH
jgi:hypothetical protein